MLGANEGAPQCSCIAYVASGLKELADGEKETGWVCTFEPSFEASVADCGMVVGFGVDREGVSHMCSQNLVYNNDCHPHYVGQSD